jgi:N6-L-threonylcarbamoyladenine synthase
MLTLGIETSCDETSVAVVRDGREVLSNVILSQLVHGRFGGVVPEVASREHVKAMVPVYRQALSEAGITLDDIQLIAATLGPGLAGPLLVGLTFAKGLAYARDLPFVPVNHLEGHIVANILEHPDLDEHHLTLVVSGGHTLLVEVLRFGEYKILGRSRDDAAGEAFDKVAKLLGLGYPGGAEIDRLARRGNSRYHRFPRALRREEFQFSFSGLKTSVALFIAKLSEQELDEHRADIAASFQEAVVEVLTEKTVRAAAETKVHHITVSGGVAANSRLRDRLSKELDHQNRKLFCPSMSLCTDNAAMIAAAGYYRYLKMGPGELIANAIPYLTLDQV